jgi:tetratricopeptide (TPR) repeat protein
MVGRTKEKLILTILLCLGFASHCSAQSSQLHEMSLERWGQLREVERHQMKVAEKYFRERNWSVAADEYDKYLTLYEASDAASHALLKWALCQVEMRRQNTAINDGFRSVVDYWPDSDDAIAASYYVGKTLNDIGQSQKAKSALNEVATDHAKHLAGVLAMVTLADIATVEKDDDLKEQILRKLTFDALRDKRTRRQCETASLQLANILFSKAAAADAIKALTTTYQDERLAAEVVNQSRSPLQKLIDDGQAKSKADALANELIAFLREQEPKTTTSQEDSNSARELCFLVIDVLRSAKRTADVEKEFSTVAKRFGTDDQLLGRIADWHAANGQPAKARQAYGRFDDQIAGMQLIATSYRQEKDLVQAIQTYNKLITEDAENQVKWQAESATTYREFKKHTEAIALYQQLVQDDAANADRWLWETAMTHKEAGNWKEAIGFFRQSERFPESYWEMATCHRRLKQHNEAITLYNQISGGDKGRAPSAMLQIGYTQEEAKNSDKAITAFKKVCRLFPKDQYASRAHAHLQNKYKITVTLGGAKQD